MDSFARKYLIGLTLIIVVAVLWTVSGRDPRVAELNALLMSDEELADYPYPFRVRELDNGVAVMGSPRSAEVPVMRFLRAAYPELSRTAVDDPAMMAAQDVLAARQNHAAQIIRDQPDVRGIRWEIDRRWYRERGIFLDG